VLKADSIFSANATNCVAKAQNLATFEDIKYFVYITNHAEYSAEQGRGSGQRSA
jgi:hypothetical protein